MTEIPDEIRLPTAPGEPTQNARRAMDIQKWLNAIKDISVWLNGSGVPSASLGVNGNYYLDTATGDVYFKEDDAWSVVMNIVGADGADGTSITTVISSSAPVDADGNPDGTIHFETV